MGFTFLLNLNISCSIKCLLVDHLDANVNTTVDIMRGLLFTTVIWT